MSRLTRTEPRIFGVSVAIVSSNSDPEKRGRVRLHYPWMVEENESGWVRVAVPYAGDGRGHYMVPEVDDEVLVAFEEGDMDRPVVIGSLRSGRDALPCEPEKENGRKCFRSRSGFRMTWEDREGSERFTLEDPHGKRRIELDLSREIIRIESKEGDIEIAAPKGKVAIRCEELSLDCTGKMRADVSSDVGISAKGSLQAKAGTGASLEGRTAEIRGDKIGIRGTSLITQQAPLVKIN
jgi:uncharacterized protein involved in type VI secretion and phage assembly